MGCRELNLGQLFAMHAPYLLYYCSSSSSDNFLSRSLNSFSSFFLVVVGAVGGSQAVLHDLGPNSWQYSGLWVEHLSSLTQSF